MNANENARVRAEDAENMVVEFVGGPYDGIRINDLHVVRNGGGNDVGAEFTVLGDCYVVQAKPRVKAPA